MNLLCCFIIMFFVAILYRLAFGERVTTSPTIGFNVESYTLNDISFHIWVCSSLFFDLLVASLTPFLLFSLPICCQDFGGADKARYAAYPHVPAGMKGIIWVVDSCDRGRIDDSREEMMIVIHHAIDDFHIDPLPLLVFANKQDHPQAMSVSEIVEHLRLEELNNSNSNVSGHVIWKIQPACATKGDGLKEGMDFLYNYFTDKQ